MSPSGHTAVSAKGKPTTSDIATISIIQTEELHNLDTYRDDSNLQIQNQAQWSEHALQTSISAQRSMAASPEAPSTPVSHAREREHQLSSSDKKSIASQNITTKASDTSSERVFWTVPRPSQMALEQEDWDFDPEHSFLQVSIPIGDFKKLRERRFTVIASRVNVRESRKKLRGQRDAVNDEIGLVLQELRVSILPGSKKQLDSSLEQYGALQKLYETLRVEDDEYDLMEKDLIDQEWSLRLAEDSFYHHGSSLSTHASPSIEGKSPANDLSRILHSRFALNTSSDDSGFPAQRIEQVSELELVRAKLRSLESEYMELQEEEELRSTLGRTMDEDSSFALRVFPVRQAELLHYLSFYEERAAERQNILDDSVDQFPTHQYTGYDLEVLAREGIWDEQPESSDIINISISSDEIANISTDPLLLFPSGEQILDVQPWGHFTDTPDMSTPRRLAYINDWLLYMLRCSKFAIMQLNNSIKDTTKFLELDAQTIKSLVLSLWYTDQTSAWYEQSVGLAAQSYDSSSLSASMTQPLPAALSEPSLVLTRNRLEPGRESRSAFGHRSEVEDLAVGLGGLAIGQNMLCV